MPNRDDGELFARIAGPDPAAARTALAALYERHASAVLSFLERGLGRRAEAEDLLHDTFLTAARRAATFRGSAARGWLLTLAANRLRDRARRERARERREREAGRAELADEAATASSSALERALARLAPELRAVVELRHVQGLAHLEVARALGISLRTAKRRSADALARLREQMEDAG